MTTSRRRIPYLLFALGTILFIWAYKNTLFDLVIAWRDNSDYQHGFLVIPFAIAMLWRRRSQMPKELQRGALGCVLLLIAGGLRVVSARFYITEIDAWTIPIWVGGFIWLMGGRKLALWAAPGLCFLWFMCPLPQRVEIALSLPLQRLAAAGSAWVLQSFGQPAVLDNTAVLLGTETLDIARTCSGLRMLFGTFAMAFAFSFLSGAARWQTSLLVALSAPIAIGANIIRIVVTAFLYQTTTDDIARRMEHDFAGLMVILLVMLFFGWLMWVLHRGARLSKTDAVAFGRRVVFWPLVLIALLISLTIWRNAQVRQTKNQLYDLAVACVQQQNYDNAIQYLDLLLRLDPNHGLAYGCLSQIYAQADEVESKQTALKFAVRASRLTPDDLGLIRWQMDLAAKLNDLNQMIDAATTVLNHADINTKEHEALRRLAIRHKVNGMYSQLHAAESVSRFTWPQVAKDLRLATQLDPHYPQHAFRLAVILRTRLQHESETKRNKRANHLIDEMLQANSASPEAWLVRYRYRKKFESRAPQSEKLIDADLDRSLELLQQKGQVNLHIMIAAAERDRERGNLGKSAKYYEKAIAANPKDVRPYLALSEMVIDRAEPSTREKAIAILEHGISEIGNQELPLVFPLIEHLSLMGEEEAAVEYLKIAREKIGDYREPAKTSYRVQLANLEAWILAHHNRFGDAAQLLSHALLDINEVQVRNAPLAIAQAWSNVGQYCRRAGDWAGATRAYQRAASLDSLWNAQLRLAIAQRNEIEGNLSDAASNFQELATSTEDPKAAWLEAARVSMRMQLLLPTEIRDWTQFRRAMESARTFADDDDSELIRLEANHLAMTGDLRRAEQLLKTSLLSNPRAIDIRRALALLYTKRGNIQAAMQLVDEIVLAEDPSSELVLLRSNLYVATNEFNKAREVLSQAIDADNGEDMGGELTFELARLEAQLGNWRIAEKHLQTIQVNDLNLLPITELQSRLAWCQKDWDSLKECEQKLRDIEGSNGALWRTCRIRRILGQATESQRKPEEIVAEATSLAEQLRSLHPRLQSAQISSARVATFRGMLWQAVEDYERAWNLGIPRISVAVDLIGLLNELGQTTKSQRYVSEARFYMEAADQLIDQSLIELVHESAADAIRFAEAWVQDHNDSDSYLRLGRTYALTAIPGSSMEQQRLHLAKQAFEKAVELNPNNIRAWGAHFRFYAAAQPNPNKARQVLEDLHDNTEIREIDRVFGLAQLLESVGQNEAAAIHYLEAISQADRGGDSLSQLVVHERAAHFFRCFDQEQAKLCCEQALAIDDSSTGARQILIQLLVAMRTPESVERAETLFTSVTQSRSLTEEETRLYTRILYAKSQHDESGKSSRQRQILLMLRGLSHQTTEDAVLMTRILLENKNSSAAANQLSQLAAAADFDVTVLADYIEEIVHLSRRNPILAPSINQVLLRIETMEGHEIESLRLRLKQLANRSNDAEDQQMERLIIIEQFTQRCLLAIEDAKSQSRFMRSVFEFLIQRDDLLNAIQLARLAPPPGTQKQWGTAFTSSLTACHEKQIVPHRNDIEQQLTRWLNVYPDDAELCFSVANLRFMQGNTAEAIRLHKKVLAKIPDHPMTLNNLALAMLHSSDSQERSKKLINRALQIQGRQPELLDTLAVVQLKNGNAESAIKTLQEALPIGKAEPTMLLHLAQAHLMLGDADSARSIFSGLAVLDSLPLSPIDQDIYSSLTERL